MVPPPHSKTASSQLQELYNTRPALFSWIAWSQENQQTNCEKTQAVLCKNLWGKITGPPTSSQRQTASHVTEPPWEVGPQPQSSL